MPEKNSTTEKDKTKNRVLKKSVAGVGVFLGVLVFVEVMFQTIAHGSPDPEVRLFSLSISLGAGAFAAALRNGTTPAVLLALAGSLTPSASGAADRNRPPYEVTISAGACPKGTPGRQADYAGGPLAEPGMSLDRLRAWRLVVCPESGQRFTGDGLFRACLFRRSPGPNQWALSPQFYWDMKDNGRGEPITSTTDNGCVVFPDIQVGVNDGDLVYVYPDPTLTVSGGTKVKIFLSGMGQ